MGRRAGSLHLGPRTRRDPPPVKHGSAETWKDLGSGGIPLRRMLHARSVHRKDRCAFLLTSVIGVRLSRDSAGAEHEGALLEWLWGRRGRIGAAWCWGDQGRALCLDRSRGDDEGVLCEW